MAATWRRTDGDIAAVLRTLFASAGIHRLVGQKFKDPIHYAVSAVRATYGNQVIVNAQPHAQLAEPHGRAALRP